MHNWYLLVVQDRFWREILAPKYGVVNCDGLLP